MTSTILAPTLVKKSIPPKKNNLFGIYGIMSVDIATIKKPIASSSFSPQILSAIHPSGNWMRTKGKSIIVKMIPIVPKPSPNTWLRYKGVYTIIHA